MSRQTYTRLILLLAKGRKRQAGGRSVRESRLGAESEWTGNEIIREISNIFIRSWVWTCHWSRRSQLNHLGASGRLERTWLGSRCHRWRGLLRRSRGCRCSRRAERRSSWLSAECFRMSWTYQWCLQHPWIVHLRKWALIPQCRAPWGSTYMISKQVMTLRV